MVQRKRVHPVSSLPGRSDEVALDPPRLGQFAVRSSRVFLTFRGFAGFVVLLVVYLVVANTMQLGKLQAIEGDTEEVLPSAVQHVHPSLLGRRAHTIGPAATGSALEPVPPRPPPRPPPPPPPSPPQPPAGDGPRAEHCAALRAAAAEAVRLPTPPMRSDERVVVVSSGWGLPDGREQVSVRARGRLEVEAVGAAEAEVGWSLVVAAATANLRNPALHGVILYVPWSACAQQLADETPAPEAAPPVAHLPARSPHAAAAPARVVPRLRLIVSEVAPSWAEMAEAAAQQLRATAPHERGLIALSRADVAWLGSFGCISRAGLIEPATLLAPSCRVAPRCLQHEHRANWTVAYARCRERGNAAACVSQLDLCHKYNKAHHALVLPSPPRHESLRPLRTLNATFGAEATALAGLARHTALRLLNPCAQLGAECGHCARFSELQAAWRAGSLPKHLAPAPLQPPLLQANGSCAALTPHASAPPPAARATSLPRQRSRSSSHAKQNTNEPARARSQTPSRPHASSSIQPQPPTHVAAHPSAPESRAASPPHGHHHRSPPPPLSDAEASKVRAAQRARVVARAAALHASESPGSESPAALPSGAADDHKGTSSRKAS
eukprot:Transcript_23504.p1 GENE.Transcript_23504~~Transcript_23504.p1  ORF type:complete len:611 (-),score=112.48 Transcript_23504:1422-3254(-)